MLKLYDLGGLTLQYEEGEQPDGATEHVEPEDRPKAKQARQPANKAGKAADK